MTVDAAPTLRIEFDLNQDDLAYFRERLHESRKAWKFRDEAKVMKSAEALVAEALKSSPPNYVVERIDKLKTLIAMLTDRDWKLEGDDREHVLDMLAYFADPADLIPDRVPGIGFLDDAIMIELVAAELEPEMEAYSDFCINREELKAGRADANPVDVSREYLQSRMRRRRRRRGSSGDGRSDALTSLFSSKG